MGDSIEALCMSMYMLGSLCSVRFLQLFKALQCHSSPCLCIHCPLNPALVVPTPSSSPPVSYLLSFENLFCPWLHTGFQLLWVPRLKHLWRLKTTIYLTERVAAFFLGLSDFTQMIVFNFIHSSENFICLKSWIILCYLMHYMFTICFIS